MNTIFRVKNFNTDPNQLDSSDNREISSGNNQKRRF